jgi:hypothetical protein
LGRRAQAGGRREGFSLIPSGRFLISMPHRACGSGAAHSSGNLKRYLSFWFPEARCFSAAPRATQATRSTAPRFRSEVPTLVRSPQHDVFAPRLFSGTEMETDGKHCRNTRTPAHGAGRSSNLNGNGSQRDRRDPA